MVHHALCMLILEGCNCSIWIWGLHRNKVAPMPGGFCSPIRTGWVSLGDHCRWDVQPSHVPTCHTGINLGVWMLFWLKRKWVWGSPCWLTCKQLMSAISPWEWWSNQENIQDYEPSIAPSEQQVQVLPPESMRSVGQRCNYLSLMRTMQAYGSAREGSHPRNHWLPEGKMRSHKCECNLDEKGQEITENGCNAGRERFTTCRSFGQHGREVRGGGSQTTRYEEPRSWTWWSERSWWSWKRRWKSASFVRQPGEPSCFLAAAVDLWKILWIPGGKKDTWDQTLMHRGWLVRQHSASRKRLLRASIPVAPWDVGWRACDLQSSA